MKDFSYPSDLVRFINQYKKPDQSAADRWIVGYRPLGNIIGLYTYARSTDNIECEHKADKELDELLQNLSSVEMENFTDILSYIGCGLLYLLKNGFVEGEEDEIVRDIDFLLFEVSNNREIDTIENLINHLHYISLRVSNQMSNIELRQLNEKTLINLLDTLEIKKIENKELLKEIQIIHSLMIFPERTALLLGLESAQKYPSIKTYVINLEFAVERKQHVLSETAKYRSMNVEIVNAIDGKALDMNDIDACFDIEKFKKRYCRYPRSGEIGCTLSHRKCYEKLLASSHEYALILEDDVLFRDPKNLEEIINCCLSLLLKRKPMVITLSRHYVSEVEFLSIGHGYYLHKIWRAYGTNAYLINRAAAHKMVKKNKSYIVADDYKYMRQQGITIYGLLPNLSSGLTSVGKLEQGIQKEPLVYLKTSPLSYRLNQWWERHLMHVLHKLNIVRYRKIKDGFNV